jgi:Na+-exporting ATPase
MIINSAIGFYQEYKGEKTMEALKNMSSPISRVLRNHEIELIPTREVVPGDIVYLEEGDICPADMRLCQAVNLELDEALLTGESLPVSKFSEPIVDDTNAIGVGDRKNMAFMNTIVTKGRGHGIVISSSLCTEIGKIAESLSDDNKDTGPPPGVNPVWWKVQGWLGWHSKTPLQVTMDKLMYALLGVAIVLGVVVFATAGFVFSESLLLYAVSVGVAILPEGLPAVVTVTMSVGVARMAKQKAIVRRLNALEALGQVTNICSDKTGTLTEGKMVVTRFWVGGKEYDVDGKGLLPQGDIVLKGTDKGISTTDIKSDQNMYMMMLVCKKCTTCDLFQDEEDGNWKSTGDPTEVALEVVARKALDPQDAFIGELEFVGEHPFDATIKRMTTVYYHRSTNQLYLFVKGAMERVLEVSSSYATEGGSVPVDATIGPLAEQKMLGMAGDAMRVLGLGYKVSPLTVPLAEPIANTMVSLGWDDRAKCEEGLTFLGVIGMFDPPRKETLPAVRVCHNAGITVHMATGDHPKTAEAVAKLVEIITPQEPGLVLPASEFDKMTDAQIDALVHLPNVLARCSPQTKVKMVDALHRRGLFVAMTGDGSNDAPAIKKSDVGIAMGLGGSEVTKQVAAIVLTDDNFETIVNAVAEGRRIFLNITKFVVHLLSGNVAEVIALICGLAMRDYSGEAIFPMSPIQILWLNMFTSSPVALCLGQEAADPDIMLRPPRSKKEGLFSKEVLWDTFAYGIFMGIISLAAFIGVLYSYAVPNTLPHCNHYNPDSACNGVYIARGTSFTTLTFFLLVHGFNCRDSRRSMFNMRLYENKLLFWTILVTAIATILTLYIPFVNDQIFGQMGLSWYVVLL